MKKFYANGSVTIPKEIREGFPSDELDIKLMDIEVEPGIVKTCIVLVPVGKEKQQVIKYI
jgi:bifunctional DNA-binding transcriptional regulator/antitoxin component of YhaV-PrlF toxin-antitoxin module